MGERDACRPAMRAPVYREGVNGRPRREEKREGIDATHLAQHATERRLSVRAHLVQALQRAMDLACDHRLH